MAKSYYAYIRVSTTRQGDGVSLQEQQHAIEAHARKYGLSIIEWFEEKESAAKEGRTAFTQMLRKLQARKAHGVIIHKIDRSARNLWDWGSLSRLADQGVDVRFAHDGIDLTTRGGRLAADMIAAVSADYVRNLREEVKKGVVGRLKQGYYPLPAPIGYLDCGGGKVKEIDPVKGPLVTWLFERYASGKISLHTLAVEAQAKGLTARHGGKLHVNPIADMLRNSFYIGIIHIKRSGETYQGLHRPLVSQQTFERVKDILSKRLRRKTLSHEYLYRAFLKCSLCGWVATGERKKGRYVYYRCFNKWCSRPSCRETDVQTAVLEAITKCKLRPRDLKNLNDLLTATVDSKRVSEDERNRGIQLQLYKSEDRLNRLTDALLNGHIDQDMYETRKMALVRERRALSDLMETSLTSQAVVAKVRSYLELQNSLQIRLFSPNMDETAEMARLVTQNCELTPNGPVITLRNPYSEFQKWVLSCAVDRHGERMKLNLNKLLDRLFEIAEEQLSSHLSPEVPYMAFPKRRVASARWEHGRNSEARAA